MCLRLSCRLHQRHNHARTLTPSVFPPGSSRCDPPVVRRAFVIQRALSNFTLVLNNTNVPSAGYVEKRMFRSRQSGKLGPALLLALQCTGSSININARPDASLMYACVGYICIGYRSGLKVLRVHNSPNAELIAKKTHPRFHENGFIGGLLRLSSSFTPDLPIEKVCKMLGVVCPEGVSII